jgi:Rdx family protein
MDLRAGAARLKKDLDKQLGTNTKIKMGAPGALDVIVDGRKIFSYKEQGRIPTAADIVRAVS